MVKCDKATKFNENHPFIKRWSVAESFAIFENHDYIH